jgi:hypothetical protein
MWRLLDCGGKRQRDAAFEKRLNYSLDYQIFNKLLDHCMAL